MSGVVIDESGAPIVGATVSTGNGKASTVTNAQGRFSLYYASHGGESPALTVRAANYATVSRPLGASTSNVTVTMRSVQLISNVALPTGSQTPVAVTLTQMDANTTLVIPADGMVDAAGNAASGNANVRLTYWSPNESHATAPGALIAAAPPTSGIQKPLLLSTFGMVDIEVEQGNALLQVAPNKTLGLQVTMPQSYQTALAQLPNNVHGPLLFYMNTTTGLWTLDGNLTYDANAGQFNAELPHLTAWNLDNYENFVIPSYCTNDDVVNGTNGCVKPGAYNQGVDLGGCVTGKLVDTSGNPIANASVWVWLPDWEHVSRIALTTDSTGTYCGDVGVALCYPSGNNTVTCGQTSNTIEYFVSAGSNPDASSECDPLPANCKTCPLAWSSGILPAYCNSCSLLKNPYTGQGGNDAPVCAMQTATIQACSYCPGAAPGSCPTGGAINTTCTQLPPITAVAGQVPPGGTSGGTKACAQDLVEGQACDPTSTTHCCQSPLLCEDYLCILPN